MLHKFLLERHEQRNPIRVGVIGVGKFGGGLVTQISQMKGMVVGVVADLDIALAQRAYANCGYSDCVEVNNVEEVNDSLGRAIPAVTSDPDLLCRSDLLDVVVDATGNPEVGALYAPRALSNRKHLIMANVEADVCFGAYLRRLADENGVVYSMVDGDQPGSTMNLVNWARSLGFEIVAAGRGTVYYEGDREGIPDTVPERYGFSDEVMERRHINLKMYNSFRDGTKAQTEIVALANGAGLVPDIRGAHEPSVILENIPQRFSLKSEGGLLSQSGVVDLANSVAEDGRTLLPDPLSMGVFAVIRSEHPHIREDLGMYELKVGGDGSNFLLYRPYHLVAVEAPVSIAQAALFGVATGSSLPTPTADLVTVAKRDLKAGEMLDGGGGYTVNGLCEKATVAQSEKLLPLALATKARLKVDVPFWQPITYSMVDLPASETLTLRRHQDALKEDSPLPA